MLGIALFCALVLVASTYFRPQLTAVSRWLVARFGYAGFFVGPFLADAFSFPAPPQLYLLAAISTQQPGPLAVGLVSAGSVLGGNVGRLLGSKLGDRPFLARLLGRTRPKADALFARYGFWAVAVGALLPVPYSVLCYLAGVYRMPAGIFAGMSLLRVPRLIFFYYVLKAGFGTTPG